MKRGKDETSSMGPMFPKLHVTDADKGGGPRAPPRNKMALYEQLNIPSQRYSNSAQSKPNTSASNVVPRSSQVPQRHHHEKHFDKHMDFGDSPMQIVQKKNFDEDDYRVPILFNSTSSQSFHKISTSKGFSVGCDDGVSHSSSNEGLKFRTDSSVYNTPNISSRLRPDDSIGNAVVVLGKVLTSGEKNSSVSLEDSHSKNQNRMDAISNAVGSLEASVSENENGADNVTPDEVVGLIGQKHFWKARRAIANQQRLFGIQVFELHRLINVQRLIATTPNLLVEEAAAAVIFSRPAKTFSGKKKRTTTVTACSSPKQRDHPQQQQQQRMSENIPEDSSGSAARNDGSRGALFCVNHHQLHGHHQLLIPVISPSEGLIYKPYPGLGFPTPTCEGCGSPNPGNNFLSPGYGVLAAATIGRYGTVKSSPHLSTSSVDQATRIPSCYLLRETGPQASSTASSPMAKKNNNSMLQLFPEGSFSPVVAGKGPNRGDWPIKAVPRNGVSASESAARIFRCIQEERKRHGSV